MMTMNDQHVQQLEDQQLAFEEIINRLLTAPIFTNFHHEREVLTETIWTEDFYMGDLGQKDEEGVLHPVA